MNHSLGEVLSAWRTIPFVVRRSRLGLRVAQLWNTIYFRAGRTTYAQREKLDAARLGSQSAWALVQVAFLPLISAASAVLIFGLGPGTYGELARRFNLPVLVRLPPVDPQTFPAVSTAIAQAAAAVLAIFFAAISVVASTGYAKLTTQVRSLIAHDPLNRRYLRVLAHLTATGLAAAAMESAGYLPSTALLWYLLALAGVCMAAFLPLGVRTFTLFDPDSLATFPTRSFARALNTVEPSGHRWLDENFQNHANRIASDQLDLLADLVAFAISEARPRNNTLLKLMRQVLRLGAYYSTQKSKVPTESRWFARRASFRRWELSDSTATELAIQTGGTPAPEPVADLDFVESHVNALLRECLQHLVRQQSFDDVATVLQHVGGTSTTYAKHFGQTEAAELNSTVRGALLPTLKTVDVSADLLKYLQIVDLIGYAAIGPVLYSPLAISERSVDRLLAIVKPLESLDRKGIYSNAQPRIVIKDAENLFDRLMFEKATEGTVRTQAWYLNQIIALAWAAHIRDVIKTLPSLIERDFLTPSQELITAQRSMLAAVLLQRAIEACQKSKNRIESLEPLYEQLKTYQVAELEWKPSGSDNALSKVEEHRARVVELLASTVPELLTVPTDERLPDLVGPARAWIGDELLRLMDEKQEGGFRKLFGSYFAATIGTHDRFAALMRETSGRNYLYAAINTLLDVMDISGFALLFSEVDGTSFGTVARAFWDRLLSDGVGDATATIQMLYTAIDARFDGPIFTSSAMRRQEWGRKFASALQKRGVITERHFDPFERRHARHVNPVIESFSVMYGNPMDEAHDYFAALYLAGHPKATGIPLPRTVESTIDSIDLARERAAEASDATQDDENG